MAYNIAGIVSSLLFLGCLAGLFDQIRCIYMRRRLQTKNGYATQSLSVNGFFSSFIAFYAFFLYSIMLVDIDYYIFFTRLFASIMTCAILYEIYRDRRNLSQKIPFLVGIACMLSSFLILFFRDDVRFFGKYLSTVLVVSATIIVFQGGVQQILKICQEKCTGALSMSMTIVFFAKDLSNFAFGLVLGFGIGWPLLLMGGVSALLKLCIIAQFVIYPKKFSPSDNVSLKN